MSVRQRGSPGPGQESLELEDPTRPYEACPPEIVTAMGGKVPTVQQWVAISQPLRPYVIVAGAGSGKTSLMAARIAFLTLVRLGRIEADHDGTMPSEVLGLTFTNKAAEHLARRTRDAVAGLGLAETEEPTVLTYHAFGAGLLSTYGARLRLDADARLLTDAHKWELVGRVLADRTFEHVSARHVPTITANILGLSDQCSNLMVTPEEVRAADQRFLDALPPEELESYPADRSRQRQEVADAVTAYREAKQQSGWIDYGDQIELAVHLAEEHPDVGAELRERFATVLLDEYQDTNRAQARMMRALFVPPFPVTAVGDPDQNIFAWRGASLVNILDFATEFEHPDGTPQLPLYVNFRSGSKILAAADGVIGQVDPARRAADKRLIPHPGRGEGIVQVFAAKDQVEEADAIADRIQAEVRAGRRYQDIAVLCRKKRLFRVIDERLRARDIPVEMVDMGGLLKSPEVVDLVAYLRVIADPSRNIALARLLMGPRWRIGYRDLACLSRWSARHNAEFRESLDADDVTPGETAFALAEALDQLDQIEGLSSEARERLARFRDELADLRSSASGTPADLAFSVAETMGLFDELDASPRKAAAGMRQNVMSFLDHLASFAPIEGEATLPALLDYLDQAEEADYELEGIQPSEEDTVKLMTIHKAKGLEWDVVFVPGMATGKSSAIFPDTRREENPLTALSAVPYSLRPEFEGFPDPSDYKAWRAELTARALEAERRNCYVAMTRARDVLVCSAAQWYEGSEGLVRDPFKPSEFYVEIRDHEAATTLFQHPLSEEEKLPENNPMLAVRAARALAWPPAARTDEPDGIFPEGWRRAAEQAVIDPGLAERLASDLTPTERREFEERRSAALDRIAYLSEHDPVKEPRPLPVPGSLGVTSLTTYARCPKQFYWSVVRPLPRRPGAAARLGTAIHRWIEQESKGQGRLLDLDAFPDVDLDEERTVADETRLKETWRASRFASALPLYTERPFLVLLDGWVIRGRIDAIYGQPDGAWEVVDFKTGRIPEGDPLADLQLDIYALACAEVWGKAAADLTLTYYYLAADREITRPAGSVEDMKERLRGFLSGIGERRFGPTPGEYCHRCDFLSFCDAGKRFLAQAASREPT